MSSTNEAVSAGVGFGSALALAISYSTNHSIGWAILHGIFGWGFVFYAAITYP